MVLVIAAHFNFLPRVVFVGEYYYESNIQSVTPCDCRSINGKWYLYLEDSFELYVRGCLTEGPLFAICSFRPYFILNLNLYACVMCTSLIWVDLLLWHQLHTLHLYWMMYPHTFFHTPYCRRRLHS